MTTCRLLPQGAFPLVPTVLTTMAWLAALFQDDCDYSRVTGDVVGQIATSPDTPWLEVGIQGYREPQLVNGDEWQVTFTGQCLEYPPEYVDTDNDPFWKAAKAFSFLSLVLGGGGTFFLWFSSCCTFSRGTWRWAGYEVFLASIFQACSFVFFRTHLCQQNDCQLFWGSRSDIVAATFWFTASLCIFCYYPQPIEDMDDMDGIMVDSTRSGEQQLDHHDHDLQLSISHEEKMQQSPTEKDFAEQEQMASGQASQQEGAEPEVV